MRSDLQPQEITRFLGVNLRQERADLADDECAKAINADFNTTLGSIMVRNGRQKQFSGAFADANVRLVTKINSIRYQVAGQSVYRAGSTILTNALSTDLKSAIQPYRPFSDDTIWAFIADGSLMRKDNGSNTYNWGIATPANAPGVVAGSTVTTLSGSYRFKYTYARQTSGGALAHESTASPANTALTVSLTDMTVTLPYSSDPQVSHIRLYRTVSSGANYLFDKKIANVVGGGSTTTASSQADNTLGTEVEDDNDPPPNCSMVRFFNETAFLLGETANPHYLYHSKRFRPESVTEFLEIGNADDPLVTAVPIAGLLGVLTRKTKYRVTGNASQGYAAVEHSARRGTPCRDGAVATEFGAVFVAKDGVFSTNFMGPDTQIADAILPIFYGETTNDMLPVNWDVANTFCAAAWKNRFYWSYAETGNTTPNKIAVFSGDIKKWYFFDYPVHSLHVEEDLDDLVAGSNDGLVYILESGTDDAGSNISLDVQTKDYFGPSPHLRKLFLFFRADASVPSGTMTAKFYVDGTLKKSTTITGTRTKLLLRLPKNCMGYQWRINFTYSGAARAAIYGCGSVFLPLGAT